MQENKKLMITLLDEIHSMKSGEVFHSKDEQTVPSSSVSTHSLVSDAEDENLAKQESGGRSQGSGEIFLDDPAPTDENNRTKQRNKLLSRTDIFAH